MNAAEEQSCQSAQTTKAERLKALCLEHTSLLHTRHGPKGFKDLGLKWLEEEPHWPLAVKRRIHRYMHSHNLYEVPDAHDETFGNLIRHFISAANFPNARLTEETVSSRCSALIYSSAKQWRFEGLLVMNERNKAVKSATFERLWNLAVESAAAERTSRKMLTRKSVDPGDQALPSRSLCSPESNDSNENRSKKRSCEIENAQPPSPKKTRVASPIPNKNDGEESSNVSGPEENEGQAQSAMFSDLRLQASSNQTLRNSDPTQLDGFCKDRLNQSSFTSPASPLITAGGAVPAPDPQTAPPKVKVDYASSYSPSSRIGMGLYTAEKTSTILGELVENQEKHNLARESCDLPYTPAAEEVQHSSPSVHVDRNIQLASTFSDKVQHTIGIGRTQDEPEHPPTMARTIVQAENPAVPNHQYVAPLDKLLLSLETGNINPDKKTLRYLHDVVPDTRTSNDSNFASKLSTSVASISATTASDTSRSDHTSTQRVVSPFSAAESMESLTNNTLSSSNHSSCDRRVVIAQEKDSAIEEKREQPHRPNFIFINGPKVTTFARRRREKPRYILVKSPIEMQNSSITDPNSLASHLRVLQPCNDYHIPTSLPSDSLQGPCQGSNGYGNSPRSFPFTHTDVPSSSYLALHDDGSSNPKSHTTSFLDKSPSLASSTLVTPSKVPALTFTDCNRVISQLGVMELHQVMSSVEQTARIITGTSRNAKLWPMNIILNQSLLDFYNWYSKRWDLVGKSPTRTLRFTFLDVPWETENKFLLPADDSDRFRMLKQCIWDWFWTANYSKKRLTNDRKWWFRVRIEPVNHSVFSDELRAGSLTQWNAVNKNPSSPPVVATLPNTHSTVLPPIRAILDKQISQTTVPPTVISALMNPPTHTEDTMHSEVPQESDRGQGAAFSIPTRNQSEPAPACLARTDHSIQLCQSPVSGSSRISGSGALTQATLQPQADLAKPKSHPQPESDTLPPPPQSPDPPPPDPAPAPTPNSTKPEVTLRLQLSPYGPFSLPYSKTFLDPAYNTVYFFAWFASQTSYASNPLSNASGTPRGAPRRLRFTFKDANPRKDGRLQCKDVEIGDEKEFRLVRDTVEHLYSKTWRYFPGALEWVVLVTALPDSQGSEKGGKGTRTE